MNKIIIVKNCLECPFGYYKDGFNCTTCTHPEYPGYIKINDFAVEATHIGQPEDPIHKVGKLCPLKKEPYITTIKLPNDGY